MNYFNKRQIPMSYDEALEKVKTELKKEGFGILTEIDVKATLKQKLGVDFDKYTILGACNPPFAYQALQAEKDIGLLMPCNVIVYEDKGKTSVAAIRPSMSMTLTGNPGLAEIASQVESKLIKAMDAL